MLREMEVSTLVSICSPEPNFQVDFVPRLHPLLMQMQYVWMLFRPQGHYHICQTIAYISLKS